MPIRPRGQVEWRLDHLKKRRWRALSGLRVKSLQPVVGKEPSAGCGSELSAEEYSRLKDHDHKSSDVGEHRIVPIESHAAYSAPAGGE